MDSRVELVNKISIDILHANKNSTISSILNIVRVYDKLLDDTLRNFYEIKMDQDVPLFTLCEYLELGKDNYGITEEEFKDEINKLLELFNFKFLVNYEI